MTDPDTSPPEPPSASRGPADESAGDDDAPPRHSADLPESGSIEGPLAIELIDRGGLLSDALARTLHDQVASALGAATRHDGGPLTGEVRLEIVNDDDMARAHMEFLEVEGTTDVLTFDLAGGASAPPPEGLGEPLDVDIMICVDVATRRAAELGHPVEHEMTLYAVHGAMHCLGFDDIDEAGAARMHTEEDRLLEAAGLGAVFHAEPSRARLVADGEDSP